MPDNENPWEFPTGLVSDYEGTIVSAGFEESQYGCQLVIEMETDIPEKPLWKEFYRCGPDWHTLDGGDTTTHREKSTFNKNTQIAKFAGAAAKLAGTEITDRGSPTNADIWIGSRWYFEGTTTPARGEFPESTKNYPTKFLGFHEVNGQGSSTVVDGDVLGGVSAATVESMTGLAKELTKEEWLDKILDIDEVVKDSKLVSACANEEIYERLRDG